MLGILWLIIGLITIANGDISVTSYVCVWIVLVCKLFMDSLDNRRF